MNEYEDTYFLNRDEASKIASFQNKCKDGRKLQICYYDGEKLDSDLVNLIHLPMENMLDDLLYGRFRIPSVINCDGLALSEQIKANIIANFNMSIFQLQGHREQYSAYALESLKKIKLDFDEPLRFYIPANSSTRVMQYISKNIADTLKRNGYDVFFDLYKGIEEPTWVKHILDYNPHAVININNLNNGFLNDDCFNFVWMQDPINILTNEENIYLRDKDYLFHLSSDLEKSIIQRGASSQYQPFCINEQLFKKKTNIKKEKKIVYIGSSYEDRVKDKKNDKNFSQLFKDMSSVFEDKSHLKNIKLADSDIKYFMIKYNKPEKYINDIYAYLVRDYCIEKLCNIKSNYELEVYGYGWEDNDIVKPYFKGSINYYHIADVYNSATYVFCTGTYILMQRTLEAAFCETIPLVLDVRDDVQEEYDEKIEDAVEFFHIKDLESTLQKNEPTDRNYDYLKEQYSYNQFITKCINIIKTKNG